MSIGRFPRNTRDCWLPSCRLLAQWPGPSLISPCCYPCKMQTYHEWMKGTLLITMSGCPALAVPAGFNDQGLPMGIQIVGPNRHELDCLQLAYAYEAAIGPGKTRLPSLLNKT